MAAIDSPVNDEFVASNYNSIGNGNGSNWITDAENWVTKGVPLAISSGVAQMWNSIGWAGNKIANIGSDNPEPFTDNLDYTWLVNNFDDADSYKNENALSRKASLVTPEHPLKQRKCGE